MRFLSTPTYSSRTVATGKLNSSSVYLAADSLVLIYSAIRGFQHAVANGVPIVQAGIGEDKPEIGIRAEWSGLGVYLRASPPTPLMVRDAVRKVIEGPYQARALELKKEAAEFGTLDIVEREVLALV